MKIFIMCLWVLCGVRTNTLDLGVSEIQAVCKVTLKDGKEVEGFVTFGSGGFEYKYRPHGFCIVEENGLTHLLKYNFRFTFSQVYNYDSYRKGEAKLFYVQNISERYTNQPVSSFNEEQKELTVTKKDVEKFKLLEEMVLYTKLPLDLFVGYASDKENGKIKIKVANIKSVEFLKQPSEAFLKMIEEARGKRNLAAQKDGYWVDYFPPVWYHEVLRDKKQVAYLSQFF